METRNGWRSAGAAAIGLLTALTLATEPAAAGRLATSASGPAAPAAAPCTWTGAFRWVGPATGDWTVAANWSKRAVPGLTRTNSDYVCVPRGTTVQIPAGRAIDVQGVNIQGALVMRGAQLYLHAPPATASSVIRDFTLHASLFGGEGGVTVLGRLRMTSSPSQASALTTRRVAESGGPVAPRAVGRVSLALGSQLVIGTPDVPCPGALCGGVRLRDGMRLENKGAIVVQGTGFLYANWGTYLYNRPSGLIDIQNNYGIFQGERPAWARMRAVLENEGVIQRTAGDGTSVIDVHYVDKGGRVAAQAGRLSIFSDGFPALVRDGTSIADGGCSDGAKACREPEPTPTSPQVTELTNLTGASATLTMQRLSRPAANPFPKFERLSADVVPVAIGVEGMPSANAPVRIRILLAPSAFAKFRDKWNELEIGLAGASTDGNVLKCNPAGVAKPAVCLEKRELVDGVAIITLLRARPGGTTLVPMGPRFR